MPAALRFLVVDELHTFDGAQGTDLACLIRRLRTRLQVDDALICVGTSATIGGQEDEHQILRYASNVFRQRFPHGALVGEVRQGIDEFLSDAIISSHLAASPDLAEVADPTRYGSLEDYISAQHAAFFGRPPSGPFESVEWRVELGKGLREHASFVNLLRVLDGSTPNPVVTVLDRLQRSLPLSGTRDATNLLNALCALISVARERLDTGSGATVQPFLNVKLHLWVRELRRMVCSVLEDPGLTNVTTVNEAAEEGDAGTEATANVQQVPDAESAGLHPPQPRRAPARRLRYSDDLGADVDGIHLPLVQCRECHATAWGCVKLAAESCVSQDLRVFYNRFFLRDIDVTYLFPLGPDEYPPHNADGGEYKICGGCGYLTGSPTETCAGCGQGRLARVFRPNAVVSRRREGQTRRELSRDCPYCGAREALIILGARASSLLSTALAQLYASRHNDDHKVIAFSDNVQDAALRGSFFAARTWRNSIRAAVAQVIAQNDGISLARLPDEVVSWWGDANLNPGAFDDERFISEFIAPDRLWLQDFESLREHGELPVNSDLMSLVQRRVRWDSLAELTFGSAVGRTLERTRTAAVGCNREALVEACDKALVRLRGEFGELRDVDDAHVRHLVLGILRRMKDRGAVESPMFEGYLREGGSPFVFRPDIALQDFGPRSALPVFPAPQSDRDGVEAIVGHRRTTWYQAWAQKVLTPVNVLAATQNAGDVLRVVLDALEAAGLVKTLPSRRTKVWALDPERLYVTTDTAVVRCGNSQRALVVPTDETDLWLGVPCLDLGAQDHYATLESGELTWAGHLYRDSEIRRIVSAEHTALVPREERDRLQERFAASDPKPWEPNLLSATPTLELGVDIGDLSTVVMCSVPPAPVNYVQRTGRAGRRDGNALTLTVATGQPHDLYYYAEPLEMLGSRIDPPGIFLNAPAVLERQLTAFCLDCWAASGVDEDAVPRRVRPVLDNVEKVNPQGFPYPLFDFVAEHGEDLLARFFAAFESRGEEEEGLDDSSRDYLAAFLHGADSERSLRQRVLDRLKDVAEDRRSLRNDVEALGRQIRNLRRGPTDEASDARLRELSRERAALQRLLRDINGRETFGFLTDEGLLPNYAFPEQGVTLNSVIYRRRQNDAGEDEHDAVVYDYVRPAVAALSEFAPENEFYAGGRRVTIQRIDTRVSRIERWRLCRSCDYCENIEPGDHHSACPTCGDDMWGDAGQVREMLRLRLVHAATPDRFSRIMDERDDREPLFYTRQLVASFDPATVTRAFAVENPDRPFGFEYVPSATFREINFGRLDEQSSATTFAGDTMPRKGFSICRRCGGVQAPDGTVQHTSICSAGGDQDIVDCLYLYREFKSEAVRMLIPPPSSMDVERHLSSFIAALELGLRKQFAGAVDHLRVMTCKFPAADSGADLTFLMLYDTVPGGTGYLKQMMNDPGNVLNIFCLAQQAISECECNADPDKDGCYRCVYAYRRSFEMASTSRNTALSVLNTILEQAEDLKEIDGLRHVKVNPFLESELEARFIEALRRIDVDSKPVRVREDIVGGKPGFVLTTTDLTYYMEAQPEFGESAGVAIPSRPDFVIRPAREMPGQPPIAVFMDGFAYHRDKTDEDSAKRMALVRAGYLVWSLTWHDLEVALGKSDGAADLLGEAFAPMRNLQKSLDTRWSTGLTRSRLGEPSLKLLVRYMQNPDVTAWRRAAFTELLGLFDSGSMTSPEFREAFFDASRQLPQALQEVLDEMPEDCAFAGRGVWRGTPPDLVQLYLALPLAAVESPEPNELTIAMHLDDSLQSHHLEYRQEWNGVLRLYNLLQFLPNTWWTTAQGVKRDVYPEFAPLEPEPEASVSTEWGAAISLAAAELHLAMHALANQGISPPEVGFELSDSNGQVIAEAELAWEARLVAVLLGEQDRISFDEAGWRTALAHDPQLALRLFELLTKGEP